MMETPRSSTKSNKASLKRDPPKPSAGQIQRAKLRREQIFRETRKAKRVMLCSSLLAATGIGVWVIAIATDGWYTTNNLQTGLNNSTTNKTLVTQTGLWRNCRIVFEHDIKETVHCKYHKLFPHKEEIKRNPELDGHVIDYRRTQITFALLSLFLMLLSLISAFYTFKNGRYMYKRLASGLYFISAACTLVVMEAVITCLRYEVANVPFNFPLGSSPPVYGYSFYLGWSVFIIYLCNGGVFLVYSRKKKWVIDQE